MYNRVIIALLISFSSFGALADTTAKQPLQLVWPFEGIFGTFDRQAAQRGAQVYFEVCSACHSNHNLYYRNLKDIGFSEAEIKQLAQKYTVKDGPNAEGEMFDRPALPSDRFVSPYPNEEAARAANNGAYPVDLSLIIKARHDGPNYVFSLLSGYQEAPADIKLMPGLYYNPYFEGGQIAMPPPLTQGQVTFSDDTPATVEQMAKDVVVFLQWAAEPEMEHRKSMGLKVMIFLLVFTVFFYMAKKKIWKNLSK
ncbi:cytochrome C [Candidatus Megaera polyxenophila]|jgi:ubiquinol-cytochrome c reductase cytochrome c1 subunit|uniref:cytochrome c1 n=1 Tax=Candidatus Megaera polyxenophila TaxID=988779 RepID=UPI001CC35841|nr:cytochrome c1 [Candidatus Megaera polyxenophila]MCC8460487.1 cytochrome c1 [Candidatus Megaera polyxenophila]WHA06625.1 cytochrome c1 [Candidatus Megaera polyxenophila]BBB56043.1 cytochrome C [Candidatus Megaera polyxenophila]